MQTKKLEGRKGGRKGGKWRRRKGRILPFRDYDH